MRSGFLIGWFLLAATVVTTYVVDGRHSTSWWPSLPAGFAAVLLVIGAVARVVIQRVAAWMEATESLRALELAGAAMLIISLAILWGGFFAVDLYRARFALVLLAVPVIALGFAIGLSIDARIASPWGRGAWWLLFAVTMALTPLMASEAYLWHRDWQWINAEYLPVKRIAVTGFAVVMCVIVAIWSRSLPAPAASSAPWISRVLFVTVSGGLVGLTAVWPLFVFRSHGGGCSGVSESFHATLLGTALALHGAAPVALGALLDEGNY